MKTKPFIQSVKILHGTQFPATETTLPSKDVLPIEDALPIDHAVQVKSAEYWLKLGEADQALRELEVLPTTSWNHDWATKIRDAATAVLRGRDEMPVQA
jgi:hypothetical protein